MKRLPVFVFLAVALSSSSLNLAGSQATATQAKPRLSGTAPIRPPATPSRTTA